MNGPTVVTASTSQATALATITADAALEQAELEETAEVCRACHKGTRGINVHMIIATFYNGIDASRVS